MSNPLNLIEKKLSFGHLLYHFFLFIFRSIVKNLYLIKNIFSEKELTKLSSKLSDADMGCILKKVMIYIFDNAFYTGVFSY